MKKFIESISNVWKIEELRNRILITLGLLLVYRFGAHVTLPGIDATIKQFSWSNQKWYWSLF
jgi:preprotein translocase subunit SecY